VIKDNPSSADREMRLAAFLRSTDQRPKLKLPESFVPVLLWPHDPPKKVLPSVERESDPAPNREAQPPVAQPELDPDPDPGTTGSVSATTVPEPIAEIRQSNAMLHPEVKVTETPHEPLVDEQQQDAHHRKLSSVNLTLAEQQAIEDRWDLKGWRGGKVTPERRAAARLNRCRFLRLTEETSDDALGDAVGAATRDLPMRFWLVTGIEDMNLNEVLALAVKSKGQSDTD
jgi:hypothetical protein